MSTKRTRSAMTLLDELKFRLHCLREIGQCAHGLVLRPEDDTPEVREWAASEGLGVLVSQWVPETLAVLTQADPRDRGSMTTWPPPEIKVVKKPEQPSVTIIPKQPDLYS